MPEKNPLELILENRQDKQYSIAMFIEDDGHGIEPEKLEQLLQRGIRADEHIHGHGIGLAVVQELIVLLNGRLAGDKSGLLGGMKWIVYLP